jgi:iron-sulfur cluster repair protein YtfE (RIC family)
LKKVKKKRRKYTLYTECLKNVVDAIESLYRNLSESQHENINLLREEQKYLIEWRYEEIANIKNSVRFQKQLISYFEYIKKIADRTTNEISGLQEVISLLHRNAEIHIEKQDSLFRYIVDDMRGHIYNLILKGNNAYENLFESLEDETRVLIFSLKDIIQSQSQSFDIWMNVQV